MDTVTLKSDGSLLTAGGVPQTDPLTCLGSRVELGAGFCLRSFFGLLEKNLVLTRLNPFFVDGLVRYRRSLANGCLYPGCNGLELSKTVEMIGYPGKPRLEIYAAFHGVPAGQVAALKSLRMENILDIPIRLGCLRHIVFGDPMDVFEFETVYTLFEFIDAIGWELGFHNVPTQCKLKR